MTGSDNLSQILDFLLGVIQALAPLLTAVLGPILNIGFLTLIV